MCQAVLKRLRIVELVGTSLEAAEPVLRQSVVKSLEDNDMANSILHQKIVEEYGVKLEKVVMDAVVDVMRSDVLNQAAQEVSVGVIEGFKDAMRSDGVKAALDA